MKELFVLFEKSGFHFRYGSDDEENITQIYELQIFGYSYFTSGKIIHFCELQFTNVH